MNNNTSLNLNYKQWKGSCITLSGFFSQKKYENVTHSDSTSTWVVFFVELVLRESVINWLQISQTALPSFKPELFLEFLPPKGLVTVITHLLGQNFVGLKKRYAQILFEQFYNIMIVQDCSQSILMKYNIYLLIKNIPTAKTTSEIKSNDIWALKPFKGEHQESPLALCLFGRNKKHKNNKNPWITALQNYV